ncbi:hypothetical protein HUB94_12935 [Paenibacillus cellulosilyticus]|nr:hypothetical protein HUB94_12935 [Paenibacillus cellulosilyticus]
MEENTIAHVENHIRNRLKREVKRADVKDRLMSMLNMNLISIHDKPIDNSIDFFTANEEFVEDF